MWPQVGGGQRGVLPLPGCDAGASPQHTEALLYGFQSIAETIDVNYSDVVPGLIGLIPRISISNVQLADTVMFTIGEASWGSPGLPSRPPAPTRPTEGLSLLGAAAHAAGLRAPGPASVGRGGEHGPGPVADPPCTAGALSEWLADHPVMINNVLPLVLQALGNPELSISSVSTLKKICRECKYDLPPYAANIVAVSQVRGWGRDLGLGCVSWASPCSAGSGLGRLYPGSVVPLAWLTRLCGPLPCFCLPWAQ